jgi:hypothetical protein
LRSERASSPNDITFHPQINQASQESHWKRSITKDDVEKRVHRLAVEDLNARRRRQIEREREVFNNLKALSVPKLSQKSEEMMQREGVYMDILYIVSSIFLSSIRIASESV